MTPLQRIAMGFVVVFGVAEFPADPHPSWRHYDALVDPVGWLLIAGGVLALHRLHRELDLLRWLTIVAGLLSVPLWLPQINHQLVGAGVWAALLPQNLVCLVLCRELGRLGALQEPRDGYVAKRFGLLGWGFGVVTLLPIVIQGGGIEGLDATADAVKYVVVIASVYYLFRVHRRSYLAGPGPLRFEPAGRAPTHDPGDDPEDDAGDDTRTAPD